MSELIDKAALLIWLDGVADNQHYGATYSKVIEIYKEVQSGNFDVHIGEGISVETLEKIGKQVAEIRAEAAEKECDELRKQLEWQTKELNRLRVLEQGLSDFQNDMMPNETAENVYAWIESTTGFKNIYQEESHG